MNTKIKRLATILKHPHHRQIMGSLIEFNDKNKIVGKCALGEIGCQSGIKPEKLLMMDSTPGYSYSKIMQSTKIPKFLITGNNLPVLYFSIINRELPRKLKYKKQNTNVFLPLNELHFNSHELRLDGTDNIDDYIYHLNDSGFKYKQIAEFLQVTFGDI